MTWRNVSPSVSRAVIVALVIAQFAIVGVASAQGASSRTTDLPSGSAGSTGLLTYHTDVLLPTYSGTQPRAPQSTSGALPPRGMLPASSGPSADVRTTPHLQFAARLGSPASSVVQSTFGFDGASACDGQPCGEPPDPWVAVGPQHIVQAVNQQVRISSRAGGSVSSFSLASFFAEPVGQIGGTFDPRVLYVPSVGRWVADAVSFDCTAGHLYLALSNGSDPTAAWAAYQIDYPGYLPDYPGLGISSDKVVLSSNLFPIAAGSPCSPGTTFAGSVLDVVDLPSLVAGGNVPYTETTPNSSYFTWRPSVALSSTNAVRMVAERASGSAAGDVAYGTIAGTNAGSDLVIKTVDLTASTALPAFVAPPMPHGAAGFTSDTIDERPTDALWMDGILWFVSTYPCVPSGDSATRDCVRVTALGTSGATPSAQEDFLLGAAGYDYFMGGIGLAADGTLFVVLAVASDADFIGSYAAVRFVSDAPNTVREPLRQLHAGEATYVGARWGDYVGVAQDPTNAHQVWQGNQYANATGTWSTWISALSPVFTDIDSSSFKNDIIWLYQSGITKGCSPTTFCPNGTVTRGQMATFLARAFDLPATDHDYFTDDEEQARVQHQPAPAAGITTGCDENRSAPTAS